MHHTIQQRVKRFAVQIQSQLEEQVHHRFELRKYKPLRDGVPSDALDPRREAFLFYLKHRQKAKRPNNLVFDHDWSYSATWDGLRLRVTTYCITRKQENIVIKLLQKIATEHDIIVIVDVTQNSNVFRCEHWGKYRIVPKGPRLRQ